MFLKFGDQLMYKHLENRGLFLVGINLILRENKIRSFKILAIGTSEEWTTKRNAS